MNKWLLIWNIILTVLMVGMILGGCTSTDPRLASIANQVQINKAAIEQLKVTVERLNSITNQNSQLVQSQAAQIGVLQAAMDASLKQFAVSLQEYVKQYVEARVR